VKTNGVLIKFEDKYIILKHFEGYSIENEKENIFGIITI
jgi:hypothetical protein